MIEWIVLSTKMITAEPQQPPVPPPSTYQAPKWSTDPSSSGSVPTSKQIEDLEEELHESPK